LFGSKWKGGRNRVNNFNPFVQKGGKWQAVYKNKLNWNANFMLIERGFYAAVDFMSCFFGIHQKIYIFLFFFGFAVVSGSRDI